MGGIPLRRDGPDAETRGHRAESVKAKDSASGLGTLLREKGGKVAGVALLLLLAAGYAAWQGLADTRDGTSVVVGADPNGGMTWGAPSPGDAAMGSPSPTPELLRVQIVGAVLHPGIYVLAKGSCLDELIRLAGGFTQAADVDRINRVWKIEKSLLIRIGERAPETSPGVPGGTAGESGAGAAVVVTDQVSLPENGGGEGESSAPIDVNTATVAQLDALPGIGPSTAAAVVAYREKNGPFTKTQDLMKVSGIKQSRYDAIKDLVCVG